ncbi:transmembrane protein, putative (macronuclear) [Tetrahymena thermophila SB210]|uniref:Transmembrane protein, putative n=1 Tax=Tetrahymena thermophila (strain SB210) TaxID=312017 RepID=W7XBV0_TETTS|nr:transmembrane protein, putative [Tetrahymena thermophila SB210]EWS74802.1 transmembrane protein, putative [Tetrahymena thermophila SB210]|eukprot:XP_012652695.1 transmembrane protein, putative [Tetrahymena thermophila SB210]
MGFNKIDIFGSNVSIKFQGLDAHQTRVGACFTVLVFTLVFLRLIILVNNSVNGYNPTVLYQERFVQDPKMFEITPNSLSLALGLLDMNFNYYIDETIFNIQGVHIIKQNVWNNSTNQYEQILSQKVFNLVNCTDEHIPDPQLRDFFLQSNLYMHQCIPLDLSLQIQGQFNSEVYQELNFYFKKCSGLKCKNDSDINKLLSSNNVELVFTDIFFSPQNKENPFTKFSRDLYWVTSQNLPRFVNVFMRNNYVETDVGWITQNLMTNIYPSYSYDDVQVLFRLAFIFLLIQNNI